MESNKQGLSVSISVMDIEPMKVVLGVIHDMLEDPGIHTGYKLRLCAALNIDYLQTSEP